MIKMRFSIWILCLYMTQGLLAQSDTLILELETKVYFDNAEHEIREDQKYRLDSLVNSIASIKSPFVEIRAHTDLVGDQFSNQILSENRAMSVKDYLVESGIDAGSIDTYYFGEQQPLNKLTDYKNRQKNRRAHVSVYSRIERQWLKGQVLDKEDGSGVHSKIRMHSRSWADTTGSDLSGNFELLVPKDEVLGLDIVAEGYLLDMSMMRIKAELSEKRLPVALERIDLGKKIMVERLFFVGNQDLLLEKSFNILPLVYSFMEENQNTCIEINGHINLPNSKKTKLNTRHHDLSIARARRIYNYLYSKGIDESRMCYRGFGNWDMLHPYAKSEEFARLNRRVELRIIECGDSESCENDSLQLNSYFYEFRYQDYGKYK